jgi:hypothetical protein
VAQSDLSAPAPALAGSVGGARRLIVATLICAAVALFAGPTGRLLVALPLLLLAPGFLIARVLRLPLPLPLFTAPPLWVGLSLSSLAIVYLWAWTLGLVLSAPVLLVIACALGLAVAASCWFAPPRWPRLGTPWTGWVYLCLIALTLLTRLVQIRELTLPPWVDSVHHALLIRVVAERGGIPISLRPYLPVDELPYHWGYHVVAGALLQLSELPLPQLMLWSGQVLNTLAVVAAAGLAAALWRSPLAALGAALVAGLLANMPAYYLSWGRYTQLTGMLVLPPLAMVGLLLWRELTRSPGEREAVGAARSLALCAGLLVAGLILIHYRVLLFWAPLFVLTPLIYWPERGARRGALALLAGYALPPGLGGGLLALPWLLFLARGVLASYVARPAGLVGSEGYNALNLALFWTGNNRYLLALAALSALAALWRRRRAAVLLIGWLAALMVMANPQLLGLPRFWLINNDSVLIMIYLPTAALLGGGLVLLDGWAQARLAQGPWARLAIATSLLALGVLGAWQLRTILNPTTLLATAGDAQAIAWAARETPADARFLVSAKPWLPRVNRGGDGGWWLLPLAGRWTTVPPVLYTYAAREDVDAIYALTSEVAALDAGSVAALRLLIDEQQIDYIYSSGAAGSLPAELLGRLDGLSLVYDQRSVRIFRVDKG